jgi:hypothetical protein
MPVWPDFKARGLYGGGKEPDFGLLLMSCADGSWPLCVGGAPMLQLPPISSVPIFQPTSCLLRVVFSSSFLGKSFCVTDQPGLSELGTPDSQLFGTRSFPPGTKEAPTRNNGTGGRGGGRTAQEPVKRGNTGRFTCWEGRKMASDRGAGGPERILCLSDF